MSLADCNLLLFYKAHSDLVRVFGLANYPREPRVNPD